MNTLLNCNGISIGYWYRQDPVIGVGNGIVRT